MADEPEVMQTVAVAAALDASRTAAEVGAQAEAVETAVEDAAEHAAGAEEAAKEGAALDRAVIEILTMQGEQIAALQVQNAELISKLDALGVEHHDLHRLHEELLSEAEESDDIPEAAVTEVALPPEETEEGRIEPPEERSRKRRWLE